MLMFELLQISSSNSNLNMCTLGIFHKKIRCQMQICNQFFLQRKHFSFFFQRMDHLPMETDTHPINQYQVRTNSKLHEKSPTTISLNKRYKVVTLIVCSEDHWSCVHRCRHNHRVGWKETRPRDWRRSETKNTIIGIP